MGRTVFDIKELEKAFRIVDGKLERLGRRGNPNKPKWKMVVNKVNDSNGYCCVGFNGSVYKYHMLFWALYHNKNIPEGLEIDHINGNKIDNRIENLRVGTHRENLQNKRCHRDGKLAGAIYRKREKKYQAFIMINNKVIHLGLYKTAEESHKAYKIASQHVEEYIDSDSFRAMIKKYLT